MKNISRFFTSEEGKMLNSDIVKIAATLGVIGAIGVETEVMAQIQADDAHINFFAVGQGDKKSSIIVSVGGSDYGHWQMKAEWPDQKPRAHYSHSAHGSHSSHGSHGSHGSHARGGWC